MHSRFFSSSHSAFQKSRPCLEGRDRNPRNCSKKCDSSMNSNDFCMKLREASSRNPRPLFRVRQLHEFQRREIKCAKGLYFSMIFHKILEKVRQFYEFLWFCMKFREASSRNPKMVDASTKIDDSSTNSIENIDFEATTSAEGCALSFLETGVCSSGTNSLKLKEGALTCSF